MSESHIPHTESFALQLSDPFWTTFAGIRKPHFTMVPNDIFDFLLPRLTGAQLKIILVVARATFGWQQPINALSLSDLAAKTSLNRRTVLRLVPQLEQLGILIVHRECLDQHTAAVNLYTLRMADPDANDVWQSIPRRDASKTQTRLPF